MFRPGDLDHQGSEAWARGDAGYKSPLSPLRLVRSREAPGAEVPPGGESRRVAGSVVGASVRKQQLSGERCRPGRALPGVSDATRDPPAERTGLPALVRAVPAGERSRPFFRTHRRGPMPLWLARPYARA